MNECVVRIDNSNKKKENSELIYDLMDEIQDDDKITNEDSTRMRGELEKIEEECISSLM